MVQTKEQKARHALANKKWYQKNKERENAKNKEYQKKYKQTPAGKKVYILANWKRIGLIHPDYNELYELYLNATHCEFCLTEFKNTTDRCMDHCHTTNLFRAFLCRGCNLRDVLA